MTHPVTITAPPDQPFIGIEREFDAPPTAVLEAHRDPDRVARWMGPRGYEMRIAEWDFRTGGRYRYTHIAPDGAEYGFFGSFHSTGTDLLIQTFEFDEAPGIASIESIRFEPLDEGRRTRLVGHAVYPSVEARDAMIASGMETGVVEGYERMDEVLAGPTHGVAAG